ncbi:P-loop containing nucleoside triphosphate hydrolase protein [Ganoderma leucocontextum]|nr:P-loop containing nucleoside triphosphate hydrolase protein [Ganoderma leucocontextum]
MSAGAPSTPPQRPVPLSGSSAFPPETPRRRKEPADNGLQGTRPLTEDLAPAALGARLKDALKLTFDPDPWQVELISRLLRGFDGILCAGTGYGKSLVFEGLAVLGGKGKVVLVVCPLKALERDQVKQAAAKGLTAVMINEDNSHEPKVWETARKSAQIIYLSPEMALSDGFAKMWRDAKFRDRLLAVIVDEAHCVDEWGVASFRGEYRDLAVLRHYTGQEKAFLACSATWSTSTFEFIFDCLAFGFRPFWGLDVGCDRPNLFYDIQVLRNTKNPVLDVLNILPDSPDSSTALTEIPKSLLYFDSQMGCRQAVDSLRKCLPAHLRRAVYAFSSDLSERSKIDTWERFAAGEYRILCATDAAGMGCNVPDVRYIILFKCPASLSVVAQRWGRAGRDRTTQAICLLLVPPWAFRPSLPLAPRESLAVSILKGGKKKLLEPKAWTDRRAKLPTSLEEFINIKSVKETTLRCLHKGLCAVFRPHTRLSTYTSLDDSAPRSETGTRSSASSFALRWIQLELGKSPPTTRCCYLCNPLHPDRLILASKDDPRLSMYASEFVVPLVDPPTRPPSAASVRSDQTQGSQADFEPLVGQHVIPENVLEVLRNRLVEWRTTTARPNRDEKFLGAKIYFSDTVVEKLVARSVTLLNKADVGPREVRQLIHWDTASAADWQSIAEILSAWRIEAAISATPKSQKRGKKARQNESGETSAVLPRPNFDAGADSAPSSPGASPVERDQPDNPRTPQRSHGRDGDNFDRTPTGPRRNAMTSVMASSPAAVSPVYPISSGLPHVSSPVGTTHLTAGPTSIPSIPHNVPHPSQMAWGAYPVYPTTPYWHGHYQWMSHTPVPSQYPQNPAYVGPPSHAPLHFGTPGPSAHPNTSPGQTSMLGPSTSGMAHGPAPKHR